MMIRAVPAFECGISGGILFQQKLLIFCAQSGYVARRDVGFELRDSEEAGGTSSKVKRAVASELTLFDIAMKLAPNGICPHFA